MNMAKRTTRTDEFVAAILRRYREYVAAGNPTDEQVFPWAKSFARLRLFAVKPKDDSLMRTAAFTIHNMHRYALKREASLKTVTRILDAIQDQ